MKRPVNGHLPQCSVNIDFLVVIPKRQLPGAVSRQVFDMIGPKLLERLDAERKELESERGDAGAEPQAAAGPRLARSSAAMISGQTPLTLSEAKLVMAGLLIDGSGHGGTGHGGDPAELAPAREVEDHQLLAAALGVALEAHHQAVAGQLAAGDAAAGRDRQLERPETGRGRGAAAAGLAVAAARHQAVHQQRHAGDDEDAHEDDEGFQGLHRVEPLVTG